MGSFPLIGFPLQAPIGEITMKEKVIVGVDAGSQEHVCTLIDEGRTI